MKDRDQFVAIGLLTRRDLDTLGNGFRTAFPIEKGPMFDDLLRAIDEAEAVRARKMNNGLQPD